MRLGYFTMPIHPAHRVWQETLREDRDTVVLADELGFHDAFIGEHLTDVHENITSSMIFLASLVDRTRNIRLATGTANLSQWHPVLVASNAAMMDHMSGGRFILGVSAGALSSDAEVLGILDEDRNRIFQESIDVILAIWQGEPPYNIDLPNNRFKVSVERTMAMEIGVGRLAKPLQSPRPEIVGTVLAPHSKGVIEMGKRDFHPLSANFLLSKWVATHWGNYAAGKAEAGQIADPSDWRVARTIFVADDEATARAYGRDDARSPYRFYYEQILRKLHRSKRLHVLKSYQDQPDEAVSYDYVMDNLMIIGTPDKVADQILALREELGEFGEIVYAGMDWVDPALARRSMQLMAEQVMPRVNAAISAQSPGRSMRAVSA